MKSHPITVDDVQRFAERHAGETFYTLTHGKAFILWLKPKTVTFELPGSNQPINFERLQKCLDIYYQLSPEARRKTKYYHGINKSRTEPYLLAILAEIEGDRLYSHERHQEEAIKGEPDETTRKSLYLARIGQGRFREELLESQGQCYVTRISDPRLLRASHIKEWSKSTNTERLDRENGLLLSPLYDHLFDRHLISFTDDGALVISRKIPADVITALGIRLKARGQPFTGCTKVYLKYHRAELSRLDKVV